MAITIENVVSAESSGSVSSITIPTSAAGGSDRAVYVGHSYNSGNLEDSATCQRGGSEDFTKTNQAEHSASVGSHSFYLVAPAAATATTVVTHTFGTSRTCSAGAIYMSGVDQTTPTSGNNGATGDSASPSVSITSVSGDLVAAVVSTNRNAVTVGQTLQWEYDTTSRATGGETTTASGTSTSMTYTTAGGGDQRWAMTGISFKPAAAAGTNPKGALGMPFDGPVRRVVYAKDEA